MEPFIEDLGIYLILLVILLNTVVLYILINKESKRIEDIHKFVEDLTKNIKEEH